jgi:hypothetical protein
MPEKQKHVLYITLQHRAEQPGFHWAILLARALKLESSDINLRESYLFHVTNTTGPEHPATRAGGLTDWRYETKAVNSLRSGNMIGRVLVAKLPSSTPIQNYAEYIDGIVKQVPVVQNDTNWTCRVWVENALAALRQKEGAFAVIPSITNGGDVEASIKAFGIEAMETIRNGKGDIKHASDLPHKDMRVR